MSVGARPHNWRYRGVGFFVTDKRVLGSGALRVKYYDVFYCSKCLSQHAIDLGVEGDSYAKVKYNATPVSKDALKAPSPLCSARGTK